MAEDDPIGRLRAEMDQSREGMKEFAGTLWAFYAGLTQEGFDAQQALMLTVAFLTECMRSNRSSGDTE